MRRPLVILILVSAIALFLWARSPTPTAKPVSPAESPSDAPAASGLPSPRKELYTAPRTALTPAPGQPAPSEACLKLWNDLRGMDLAQADLALPAASGCDKLPPELTRWHDQYLQQCAGARSHACEEALYGYRAAATELLTKDVPLRDISDPKVLTDKMLARLQSDGKAAGIAEAAERLLELDPDMPYAARASAMSRLEDAQATAAGKPTDPHWQKVDEALDRASRGKDDPQPYLETKLYAENVRYADPQRLRESAAEISRAHPALGVGPYHEAWAEHQAGNRERAVELLREAIRRQPQDPRFQGTLDSIKKGEAQPFQVNLSFQFNP